MTNLRKYFGFRYSNNRKMFSRNRIKRAPAVAREGCGGSGAPGAGLRGARGTPLQDFPGRRLQGFPERRLQDFPERRLQDFPERRLRVSQSVVCRTSRRAVRASFRSHPGLLREALSGRARTGFRTYLRTCSRIYFRSTVRDASEAHRDRKKRRNEGSRTLAAGPKDETGANAHAPAYWLPPEAASGAAA